MVRMRKGIELHAKLQRAADDCLAARDGDKPWSNEKTQALRELTERVLVELFEVEPADLASH